MTQALLICFREGLEAFLIIAIASLYLRRANNQPLLQAVRFGLVTAIAGCAGLGVILAQLGAMSSAWAGVMALCAMVAVVWCVVHMMSAGKGMKAEINARLVEISALQGMKAWWSVFFFTVFMVSREGIETATMIASLANNIDTLSMSVGAVMGVILAGAVGLLWVKYGHQVNLARFFKVTSWFMLVFAIQLLVYALHEFTEANLIPGIDNAYWHVATEDLAEGWIAQLLSIVMVLVPTAWLLLAHLRERHHSNLSL
jgi:high-affinity iron transporter